MSASERSRYEDLLAELFFILRGRRGRLLVTSQKQVSSALLHVLGLDSSRTIAVPKLTLEEVADLAKQFGCPDDSEHQSWPRVVFAHTRGHAQLVAATLLGWRQSNWPPLSNAEVAANLEKVEAERADARQLLLDLPEAQRMLLHRLSIFPRIFRRPHAVEIGAHPPPLLAPGALFDPLIGPWIEPLHSGYFAISTLLQGSGQNTFGRNEFHDLQNAAAL